jgi:hypothetical protein
MVLDSCIEYLVIKAQLYRCISIISKRLPGNLLELRKAKVRGQRSKSILRAGAHRMRVSPLGAFNETQLLCSETSTFLEIRLEKLSIQDLIIQLRITRDPGGFGASKIQN